MAADIILDISIVEIQSKLCVGMNTTHSLKVSKAKELWARFMPLKSEIKSRISEDLICIQVYNNKLYFEKFNPTNTFETWASVEVNSIDDIPERMKVLRIPKGNYAKFIHRGTVDSFGEVSQYFHNIWLPQSEYQLDTTRPHFEVLGKHYLGPHNPESEEEVWIPVRQSIKL